MRRLVPLSLTLALLLAGCGAIVNTITPPTNSASRLTVELDAPPNADHVGLYEAQALGYFRQADLDVRIVTPSSPTAPLADLQANRAQVAILSEPDILLARNANKVIAGIGAITQSPLAAVLSPASAPVTRVSALRGKSLGYAGTPGQAAVIGGLLAHAGVTTTSLSITTVGSGVVAALHARAVKAALGDSVLDPLELRHGKHAPGVIAVDPAAGVPTYEGLVFAVRKITIVNQTGLVRRFVQAVARGYEAARANPVAATANLVRLNPGLDAKLELAAVRASLGSFFPTGGLPWGWQRSTQWNAFGTWLYNRHLLTNPNAVTDASTNELLAGQGV